MIRILAGNFKQAEICANKYSLARAAWRYVTAAEDLRVAMRGESVWLCGTYNFRKDKDALRVAIACRELLLINKD